MLKKLILLLFILLFFLNNKCAAGDCFIIKDSMAVNQPNLAVRACDLFFQHNKDGKEKFVKLIMEKKVIALSEGTRVFDCGIDLEAMRDVDEARIQGIILPTFHCYGRVTKMVPIRPAGFTTCYWIDWNGIE